MSLICVIDLTSADAPLKTVSSSFQVSKYAMETV